MNLKYDIFGIVKNAGKISFVLLTLWGVVFGYIFFGAELGISGTAQAGIEPASGYEEPSAPSLAESETYQPRPIRIKPYTNL